MDEETPPAFWFGLNGSFTLFPQDNGLLVGCERHCHCGIKACTNILTPFCCSTFGDSSAFVRGPGPDFPKSPPRLTLELWATRTIAVLGSFEKKESDWIGLLNRRLAEQTV